VRELLNATKKYASESAEITLPQFLEEAALIADVDTMRDDVDAPTLMTLHTAKGLEFRVVFIVGLEEGLFPHSRSFDEPAQMEEERRLCYVGITRAKERLYLVHTFRRSFYGNTEPSEPSRYLADIPRHLIAGTSAAHRLSKGHKTSRYSRDSENETDDDFEMDERPSRRQAAPRSSPHRTSRAESHQFNAGDQVTHPSFGDGVVIASKIVGTDEEVQVAFPGIGVKRLVARYASLRKK
jgi:DNA helicase-2/ATP-dependent DNA helicase PcrA